MITGGRFSIENFHVFLKSDFMGLSIVVPVRDQFVKQYSMCEMIIECNIPATSSVRDGLICLKLLKLN